MSRNPASRIACPNEQCSEQGMPDQGNIVLHGFSKVNWGRRRRYRCKECGKTFGATTGTPYKRIQLPMRAFDRVAALSVEGMNKSAIARIERCPGTLWRAGSSEQRLRPTASTVQTCAAW